MSEFNEKKHFVVECENWLNGLKPRVSQAVFDNHVVAKLGNNEVAADLKDKATSAKLRAKLGGDLGDKVQIAAEVARSTYMAGQVVDILNTVPGKQARRHLVTTELEVLKRLGTVHEEMCFHKFLREQIKKREKRWIAARIGVVAVVLGARFIAVFLFGGIRVFAVTANVNMWAHLLQLFFTFTCKWNRLGFAAFVSCQVQNQSNYMHQALRNHVHAGGVGSFWARGPLLHLRFFNTPDTIGFMDICISRAMLGSNNVTFVGIVHQKCRKEPACNKKVWDRLNTILCDRCPARRNI